MQGRPVIKLSLTPTDKLLEGAGWTLLIVVWVAVIWSYPALPGTIPLHFGTNGNADGYGSKTTIFLLPFIGTILYAGIGFINKFPHIFNYPAPITEDNAVLRYTAATKMLRWLKFAIVVMFSYITFVTLQVAAGRGAGLGKWFLPVLFILFLVPVFIFIIKQVGRKSK